jgi:hypothetical protein
MASMSSFLLAWLYPHTLSVSGFQLAEFACIVTLMIRPTGVLCMLGTNNSAGQEATSTGEAA